MEINLSNLPYPVFIDADPNQIFESLVSYWETQTGLTMVPDGPEWQFFQAISLQLSVTAGDTNFTGRQQFLGFSVESALDNLVSNYGIVRLTPVPATCTLKWTFSQALNSDTRIVAGTKIQSADGVVNFELDDDIDLVVGDTSGEGTATCTTDGTAGNDYAIGEVNVVVDVTNQAFIDAGTVANTDLTSGGGATETDEALRERAIIGLEASSTAGSRASYEFWARSYSSAIVDAYAVCNTGGTATIYILENNGTIPGSATLTAVEDLLSGDTIRPMCDTVEVLAPTKVNYTINYTIDYFPEYSGTIDSTITTIEALALDYSNTNRNYLGKDVIHNQLISLIMRLGGIYNVTNPEADIEIDPNEFAEANSITITKGTAKE